MHMAFTYRDMRHAFHEYILRIFSNGWMDCRDAFHAALFMVAGSGCFSLISQLFPRNFLDHFPKISHFQTISHLFLSYFPVISHFSIISHLFLKYFPNVSHFSTIFSVTHSLLDSYFPTFLATSQLFPNCFPTI